MTHDDRALMTPTPIVQVVRVRRHWRATLTSRFVRLASGQPVTASAIAPKEIQAFDRARLFLSEIETRLDAQGNGSEARS